MTGAMGEAFAPSRRRALCSLLTAPAAALTLPWLLTADSVIDPFRERRWDYTARETFDVFDAEFHAADLERGLPTQDNERGGLAWSQALVLWSYLRMYQAYGDPSYLERFVDNADHVLAQRDVERGVADHLGRSSPVWRARNPYTVGMVRLTDAGGNEILELRAALSYNDATTVEVRSTAVPSRFDLVISSAYHDLTDEHAGLTMDRSSPDYAWDRLYRAYPAGLRVTARDLRASDADTDADAGDATPPAPGRFGFSSQPAVYAVHTGMITAPLAAFAQLVRGGRQGDLRRYAAKATEYLDAVLAAVEIHDPDWRMVDDGLGYFMLPAGAPVVLDGVEAPINQCLAMGRSYTLIAALTGSAEYARRAVGLARLLLAQVRVDAGGAYVWPYWPRFGRAYAGFEATGSPATDVSTYNPSLPPARQLEDINHAAIDLEFATTAARHGLGFDLAQLAGFGRTFTKNLMTWQGDRPTVYAAVNGPTADRDGEPAVLATVPRYLDQVARWLPLTELLPRRSAAAIFEHALAVTEAHPFGPDVGESLLAIASYNRYAVTRR